MTQGILNLWRIFICLLMVSCLMACGRKTLPIPPQDAVPAPITDLVVHQDGNKIVLDWTIPERTTAGSKLPQIQAFQILRAVVAKDTCSTCPVSFTSMIELPLAQALRDAKHNRGQYSETLLRPEHRYIYKVKTKAGWRLISDESNQVAFLWFSPPESPRDLQVLAGDQQVTLNWYPVAKMVNGEPLSAALRYRIYRGLNATALRLVGEPATSTSYNDVGLLNGSRYYYKVTAELQRGTARVEGLASNIVSARPHDLTAPPPPRNLMVVKVATGVKVLWERTMSTDLAGYNIYRRRPEGQLHLVGHVDAASSVFIDTNPPSGSTVWYYAVTSFDRAQPANESPSSQEIIYESF